jgi:transcriptional regulator with XRE-family HTH domain
VSHDPEEPAGASDDHGPFHLGSVVRRIRRIADLSQRDLARALGISVGAVAQAETGERDLPASVLARAAELAGLRLALVAGDGAEVPGMTADAVRDRVGRHFPAHLDVRYGDQDWWHGDERYDRVRPWYTFDRSRSVRDTWRTRTGTPDDHQQPRAGDSPRDRAGARAAAAAAARVARARAAREERVRRGLPDPFDSLDLTCTCPAACDELLLADRPHDPWHRLPVHVDACACRCDLG